jgi:RNA polymerase sigma factor (sigma-70 family)
LKKIKSFLSETISKNNVLSKEETNELFSRLRSGKDVSSARDKLVKSNLRLVYKLALAYKSKGIPLDDLVQEGNIGLLKAIEKFDPTKGFQFKTYAVWWIRQAIGTHLLNNKRLIRLPAHADNVQKRAAQNVQDRLHLEEDQEPTVEELASTLDVSEKVLKAAMLIKENVVSLSDSSPDKRSEIDRLVDESEHSDPYDMLVSKEAERTIAAALKTLTPKELAVLKLRFNLL